MFLCKIFKIKYLINNYYMKNIFFTLLVSAFLLIVSLIIPVEVKNDTHAQNVKFWFPMKFVHQDITAIDYEYPLETSLLSIRENPTKINLIEWIITFMIYFILIFWVSLFLRKIKK